MDDPPKRTVVRRYDPPPDDDAPKGARTKLTAEEARALLAVTTVPKGPWGKVKPRLKLAFVATTVVSCLARLVIGWQSTGAYVLDGVLLVAAVIWVAWPLVFAEKDGWT